MGSDPSVSLQEEESLLKACSLNERFPKRTMEEASPLSAPIRRRRAGHLPVGLHSSRPCRAAGHGGIPRRDLEEPFGVAQSIIQLRKEKGESLPPEIIPCGAGKAA